MATDRPERLKETRCWMVTLKTTDWRGKTASVPTARGRRDLAVLEGRLFVLGASVDMVAAKFPTALSIELVGPAVW